eukprot:gene19104-26053_t
MALPTILEWQAAQCSATAAWPHALPRILATRTPPLSLRTMHKLVLIRHGESTWNLENRFTGWTDVDLTPT